MHRVLNKIDVTPFQAEQLALPQASGYCEENQGSFSNAFVSRQSFVIIR